MKAKVDEELCTGCGVCADEAPEVFEMNDDDIAVVKVNPVPEEHADAAQAAADGCPCGAIEIEA
jgi:ferredoxin